MWGVWVWWRLSAFSIQPGLSAPMHGNLNPNKAPDVLQRISGLRHGLKHFDPFKNCFGYVCDIPSATASTHHPRREGLVIAWLHRAVPTRHLLLHKSPCGCSRACSTQVSTQWSAVGIEGEGPSLPLCCPPGGRDCPAQVFIMMARNHWIWQPIRAGCCNRMLPTLLLLHCCPCPCCCCVCLPAGLQILLSIAGGWLCSRLKLCDQEALSRNMNLFAMKGGGTPAGARRCQGAYGVGFHQHMQQQQQQGLHAAATTTAELPKWVTPCTSVLPAAAAAYPAFIIHLLGIKTDLRDGQAWK